jgi:hypothetical protein
LKQLSNFPLGMSQEPAGRVERDVGSESKVEGVQDIKKGDHFGVPKGGQLDHTDAALPEHL